MSRSTAGASGLKIQSKTVLKFLVLSNMSSSHEPPVFPSQLRMKTSLLSVLLIEQLFLLGYGMFTELKRAGDVDISEDEIVLDEDADQDKEELVDDGELGPVLNRFPGGQTFIGVIRGPERIECIEAN